MSDAVQTQVLENGSQWYRAKFTNFSDGTGETAVVKVDPIIERCAWRHNPKATPCIPARISS